jgi:hypothetical protein
VAKISVAFAAPLTDRAPTPASNAIASLFTVHLLKYCPGDKSCDWSSFRQTRTKHHLSIFAPSLKVDLVPQEQGENGTLRD